MIIFQCFRTPGKRGKLKEIYRALCVEGKRTKIGRKRENVSLMGNNSHHPTSLHQNFYKDYIYTRVESFRYITREYFLSTHSARKNEIYFYSARQNQRKSKSNRSEIRFSRRETGSERKRRIPRGSPAAAWAIELMP